jgi:potassium/hydrogen antiporter
VGVAELESGVVAASSSVEHRLLFAGAILLLGIVAALLARRLRLPVLVLFLGVGMFLGSDGPGGIYFDDAELARGIGIVGLVAILFEGGLTSDWRQVRRVLPSALSLATAGVLVTAAVVGAAAYGLFDLTWTGALLIGATVASTDAAAVFASLRFTAVRRRLASVLTVESGFNDPLAVALTIGLISWITKPGYDGGDFVVLLAEQFWFGLLIGIGLGVLASLLLPRIPPELAGFAPVATVALAALSYGLADAAGGSGFLCVYIVALVVGNRPMPYRRAIVGFHEGLSYAAEVSLFVVLGLLVFPSRLGDVAVESVALTAVLIFAARPLAVLVSTPFQRFSRPERWFLSWAGLRGAVPIVLATFALSAGISESDTIFNTVFFVVLLSALAQGLTLEPVAKRLGLVTERRASYRPPIEVGAIGRVGAEIIEHRVEAGDAVVGRFVRDTGLPRDAIVMLIVRDGTGIPPRGSSVIEAGDTLYVLVRAGSRREIDDLLDRWENGPGGSFAGSNSGANRTST